MLPLSPTECCSLQASLSSQTVCDSQEAVSLQGVKAGSSLCSAANSQAVSWRLWLDHMLLFTWSLQVLPVSHPNSRGRLVRSKCSWQCKCAFICVCVLTSALIHVSLHLLMSSVGRNTIWAVVCGKGFTLIFYLQEDCRRLIHSDVIQDRFWVYRESTMYEESFRKWKQLQQ